MAAKEEHGDKKEGAEGEAPKGGKKKMIIIIAVAAVVLIGGGVGAFLALGGKKPAEDGASEEGGEGEEAAAEGEGGKEHGEEGGEHGGPAAPAVMPLETFIVNLQVKGSFLKTTLQLEFAEPELPPTAEADTPKIRDTIIRILSSKSAQDLLSAEGKEKAREEIRDGINELLGGEDVTQVYFTEFIIQ